MATWCGVIMLDTAPTDAVAVKFSEVNRHTVSPILFGAGYSGARGRLRADRVRFRFRFRFVSLSLSFSLFVFDLAVFASFASCFKGGFWGDSLLLAGSVMLSLSFRCSSALSLSSRSFEPLARSW